MMRFLTAVFAVVTLLALLSLARGQHALTAVIASGACTVGCAAVTWLLER